MRDLALETDPWSVDTEHQIGAGNESERAASGPSSACTAWASRGLSCCLFAWKVRYGHDQAPLSMGLQSTDGEQSARATLVAVLNLSPGPCCTTGPGREKSGGAAGHKESDVGERPLEVQPCQAQQKQFLFLTAVMTICIFLLHEDGFHGLPNPGAIPFAAHLRAYGPCHFQLFRTMNRRPPPFSALQHS